MAWRPGYECELAVVSNDEISAPSSDITIPGTPGAAQGLLSRVGSGLGLDLMLKGLNSESMTSIKDKFNELSNEAPRSITPSGDALEIWDVRREWVAKWSVYGASADGGIAGKCLELSPFNTALTVHRYRIQRFACNLGTVLQRNLLPTGPPRSHKAYRVHQSCSNYLGCWWFPDFRGQQTAPLRASI